MLMELGLMKGRLSTVPSLVVNDQEKLCIVTIVTINTRVKPF